jgi:hypothetical protein
MMRRGRQEADDGSFARSVGVHTARGALLIGVAVLLGLLLLQKVDTGKGPATNLSQSTNTTAAPTTVAQSTTTTRPPSAVKVLVANGTTTSGIAATAQRTLTQLGYNALAAVDATTAAKAVKRSTTVYYAAGYDTDARKIASSLGMTPAPPIAPMPAPLPVTDLKSSNVLVLIGPDYASQHGGPTTVAPTTSTTRRL